MSLALMTVSYHGGLPRLSTIVLCALVVVLSIVWGRYVAPRLARRAGIRFAALTAENTWRVVGAVLVMVLLLAPLAHASDFIIRNPCDTCRALWPEWMCFLDCLFF